MLLCCQPSEYVPKTVETVENHLHLQHRSADLKVSTLTTQQVILDFPMAVRQTDDENRRQATEAFTDEVRQQPHDARNQHGHRLEFEIEGTKNTGAKDFPEAQDGLAVVFKEPGAVNLRTVVFYSQTLGMDFYHGFSPIKIRKASGAAKALGVKENWELMSIAGTNVETLEYDAIIEMFKIEIASLRPGLTLEFSDPKHGARITVAFPRQPLGLEFDHGVTPIKITGASVAARLLGVHENLELVSIAGTNVENMDFNRSLDLLREHIASLQKA